MGSLSNRPSEGAVISILVCSHPRGTSRSRLPLLAVPTSQSAAIQPLCRYRTGQAVQWLDWFTSQYPGNPGKSGPREYGHDQRAGRPAYAVTQGYKLAMPSPLLPSLSSFLSSASIQSPKSSFLFGFVFSSFPLFYYSFIELCST